MTAEEPEPILPGEVVLDGATIRSEADVHRVLAAALDFGPYYGHNLDALNDRLRYDVPRPVHVAWTDVETSRQRLGTDFDRIVSIFAQVADEDARAPSDERFTFSLHDLEDG
jgi:ribonuclease inhibitor